MKCASEGCTADAVSVLQFPWPSEPAPACTAHLQQAQQLMQNLGRENELRIVDAALVDAPATPRDNPPARQVIETHAVDDGRAKVLELELELERERTKRVELVITGLDQVLDKAAKLWESAKAEAPELVEKFIAQYHAATTGGDELEHVEGATPESPEGEAPPSPAPSLSPA